MKEMYKLMLADQEGKKCSNFKHGWPKLIMK
jgi:hypothetical protein